MLYQPLEAAPVADEGTDRFTDPIKSGRVTGLCLREEPGMPLPEDLLSPTLAAAGERRTGVIPLCREAAKSTGLGHNRRL